MRGVASIAFSTSAFVTPRERRVKTNCICCSAGCMPRPSPYPSACASGAMRSCAVRSATSGVTVMKPSWHSRESEPGGLSALPWPWVSQRKVRPFGATCGSTPKVGGGAVALEGGAGAAHLAAAAPAGS